jgi:hypothetical protein
MRAWGQIADGSLGARQKQILNALDGAEEGMTWREIGRWLADRGIHLHHGEISGALSNLHRAGQVFHLVERRDRCHPYVLAKYRNWYHIGDRYDEPARTKASQRKDLLESLLATCRTLTSEEFSWHNFQAMIDAVVMINAHDGLSEE